MRISDWSSDVCSSDLKKEHRMTWKIYPDNIPNESGYYMTLYYNPERNEELYKALWFSIEIGKWTGPWRWNYEYGEEFMTTDGHKARPILWKGDRKSTRLTYSH